MDCVLWSLFFFILLCIVSLYVLYYLISSEKKHLQHVFLYYSTKAASLSPSSSKTSSLANIFNVPNKQVINQSPSIYVSSPTTSSIPITPSTKLSPALSSSGQTAPPDQTTQSQIPYLPVPSPSPSNSEVLQNCLNASTVVANRLISTIHKYNMQVKYSPLLLTYSMILCANKDCSVIPYYVKQLQLLGANINDARSRAELEFYTYINDNTSQKRHFLVGALNIILNYMSMLINENSISDVDRYALRGFNVEFLRSYIDPINRTCIL